MLQQDINETYIVIVFQVGGIWQEEFKCVSTVISQ